MDFYLSIFTDSVSLRFWYQRKLTAKKVKQNVHYMIILYRVIQNKHHNFPDFYNLKKNNIL